MPSRFIQTRAYAWAMLGMWAACGVLNVGCSERIELPLRFDKPVVDLGEIPPAQRFARKAFTFTVWDKSPVVIERVQRTCGCVSVVPDLTGKELPPGSKHTVYVSLHARSGLGAAPFLITFATRPVSQQPITVTLQAKVYDEPLATPVKLILDTPLGTRRRVKLYVHYAREKSAPSLRLRRAEARFGPIQLVNMEYDSAGEKGGNLVPLVHDRLVLDLVVPDNLPLGKHEGTIELPWEHGLRSTSVPVSVWVQHPVRPSLERIFCGFMQPGQQWKTEVEMTPGADTRVTLARVASDSSNIRALVVADNRLLVEVIAPERAGRFEGHVVLGFSNSNVPELRIPVAGIVARE